MVNPRPHPTYQSPQLLKKPASRNPSQVSAETAPPIPSAMYDPARPVNGRSQVFIPNTLVTSVAGINSTVTTESS